MVRLAIVRSLTYTGMAQVRSRWLLSTYATAYRWTGNRADAEDLTAWIFHALGIEFRVPQTVQVVEGRLAELTLGAVVRHWSERYGVADVRITTSVLFDAHPPLESLWTDLTAEMHLTLLLRFVRRRPMATIADQLRVSVREAEQRVVVALGRVAGGIGLPAPASVPRDLDHVTGFVTDVVGRRRPVRFEARSEAWPVLVAACHVQAAIAGNDLPAHRFVRSLEPSAGRLVMERRI